MTLIVVVSAPAVAYACCTAGLCCTVTVGVLSPNVHWYATSAGSKFGWKATCNVSGLFTRMPPVGSVTAPCRFVIVNCCQSSQRLAPVDGSVPAASAEASGTPNVACVPGRTEAFVVKRPLAPRKPLESVTSRLVMPYMLKLDSTFPDGGGDKV